MKYSPALMSAPMVRATLEELKTQTRRIVKFPRPDPDSGAVEFDGYLPNGDVLTSHADQPTGSIVIRNPYGGVGDRIWIRETWGTGTRPCHVNGWRDGLEYRADILPNMDQRDLLPLYEAKNAPPDLDLSELSGRWRPSIHMPRWASRLTLEITDVRVQRLQDISDADAMAEGVSSWSYRMTAKESAELYLKGTEARVACGDSSTVAQRRFWALWQSINAKRAPWDSNPYVWAITFKMVQA